MRVLTAFAIGAVSAGTLVFYIVNRSNSGQLAGWQPVPPVAEQASPRVIESARPLNEPQPEEQALPVPPPAMEPPSPCQAGLGVRQGYLRLLQ